MGACARMVLTLAATPPRGARFAATRARELANVLLENSPSSVQATKRLVNGFIKEQLDLQVAAAVKDNARIRTTADFKEGVSSFLEKRKPVWTGK